jgi:hypothetical protein
MKTGMYTSRLYVKQNAFSYSYSIVFSVLCCLFIACIHISLLHENNIFEACKNVIEIHPVVFLTCVSG